MAELLERYGDIVEVFEHRGGYDLDARAKAVLSGLGFAPEDFERPVEHFSGGWKMRIALARILTVNPDVLLLDEPTNHLDLESIVWLEEWLASAFKGALLMTCHDRDFMNRIVTRVIEVANRGITTYSGNYDFYLQEREIRRDQLLASYRRQQEMLAKEEEFIARFAARASHAAQVQSRVKKLEKIERIEVPPEQRSIRFAFPTPPRSGDDVLHLHELGKAWRLPDGGEKSRVALARLLIQPLNLLVLDEPTNHLDIQSREVLLEALRKYDGTVILVSHDRHFLRHLVDRVFEIDHGALRIYDGHYDDYQRTSRQTAATH
jgi:ATP-binding cassette subfamily F protein 3